MNADLLSLFQNMIDWHKKFLRINFDVIFQTYKEEDGEELCYDVHFWIGQYSTQVIFKINVSIWWGV